MANGFVPTAQVPQVDFQGFADRLRQEAQQRYLQDQRKTALQGLMSGDVTDPTKQIMGYLSKTGDEEGAIGLAQMYKSLRGPQLTPDAVLSHQDAMARLKQQAELGAETPDIKNYNFWLSQQGVQSGPKPTPTAAGQAPPDTSFGAFLQHKKEKPPPARDVMDNKYKIISGGLDAMIQNIDDLTGSDELGSVTGLAGSIWKPPGSPGRTLQIKQKQLADQAKLGTFQDLKDASTTGTAGFGRLAVVEFNTMNQRIAALDAAQDEPSYRRELKKLRDWAAGAKDRLRGQLDKDYSGTGGDQSAPVPQETSGEDIITGPPIHGATKINVSPSGGERPKPTSGDMDQLRKFYRNPQFRDEFEGLYGKGSVDYWLRGGQ